jgi:hypothetical protein
MGRALTFGLGSGVSLLCTAVLLLSDQYRPVVWTVLILGVLIVIYELVRSRNSIMSNFKGGRGGKAKATSGGRSRGGAGGQGGTLGDGGPGGDAEAHGSGSEALGGEGGEGARHDRPARGGRGPFDVMRHPDADMIVPGTGMRLGDFGRGGDGAPPPGYKKK